MVAGRGFIALSRSFSVVCSHWRVPGLYLLRIHDALQKTLQTRHPDTLIPRELFMSLPYVLTLLVLADSLKRVVARLILEIHT
jgi:ABC-type uncharacterized transport system permease subunit